MSDLTAKIAELRPAFSGQLLQPSDAGYDAARAVHNGLVNKRPAVIARAHGTADIADAVRLGRSLGLEIAVRGGGHNVAGRGTTEGGLLIDLSLMRSVQVDVKRGVARAEGGALWKEFNRETQAFNLATTGGVVGSTGIGGLTLGGGLGWLMSKYGMALDNLRSVDLVLADGTPVRASAEDHADLFWAVRGGGGNFGVASSFEFQLHPLGPMVVGGLIAWPGDQARDVLRLFRDLTATVSDDMMLVAALATAPDGSGHRIAAIGAAHIGPAAEAEKAMQPIKRFSTPAMDAIGPIPYVALNGMLDGAFPRGALNYWKSHFLDTLSDGAIDALVAAFAACPNPMSQILLEHFHGAATRVPVDATAYALRSPGYNLALLGQWIDPAETDRCMAWTRDSYEQMRPFVGARRYMNYMDRDDTEQSVLDAVYGPNLARLRQIKKRYDPDNVFRMNLNIPPA